jgi:hypothetical protein
LDGLADKEGGGSGQSSHFVGRGKVWEYRNGSVQIWRRTASTEVVKHAKSYARNLLPPEPIATKDDQIDESFFPALPAPRALLGKGLLSPFLFLAFFFFYSFLEYVLF